MDQYPPQLRQQFFGHVLGPIGHHVVAVSMKEVWQNIHSLLSNPTTVDSSFGRLATQDLLDTESALRALLGALNHGFKFTSGRVEDESRFPLTRQQAELREFLVEAKQDLLGEDNGNTYLKKDGWFTIEGNSLVKAITEIAFRTTGLKINGIGDLINFMKRNELAAAIRPMMAGGGSFDRYIQSKDIYNMPVAFQAFVRDQEPLATISDDGRLILNPGILQIARQANRFYNDNPEEFISEGSLKGNAAGCPLKDLGFLQHTPLLDAFGASLSDEQITILTSGDNPTAIRLVSNRPGSFTSDSNRFLVVRDAVQGMIDQCVQELEALLFVLQDFERSQPNNEYLLGNIALIVGRPINPSEFARQATGDIRSSVILQREPITIS